MPADMLIKNANVITMADDTPVAEAIAIKSNEIVFVGSNSDACQYEDSSTTVVDAQGATVLPGFVEAHAHIFSGSNSLDELDL